MEELEKSVYESFLLEVKERILVSQYEALKVVNRELISLYWWIGEQIVLKQKKEGWGKSVVEQLSKDLQLSFPGTKGYSSRNLWYMRDFFMEYHENKKLQPLVAEIGWSHNLHIMSKCKDGLEQEFYLKMTKKYGWSKRVLEHQIEGKSYERFLLSQTNFETSLEDKYKHQAKLAVKDSFNFDFLEMSEDYGERELELGLIKNIRSFLLEMGGDFSFIGNQYKLKVGSEDFYIDLLLYHRRLKSLVAIELKTTKFKPEYAGQLQFYLTALNETVKVEGENDSIGIIICKGKDRTTVEFALKDMNSPMGVSSYHLNGELPENLKELLPSASEIVNSLGKLM